MNRVEVNGNWVAPNCTRGVDEVQWCQLDEHSNKTPLEVLRYYRDKLDYSWPQISSVSDRLFGHLKSADTLSSAYKYHKPTDKSKSSRVSKVSIGIMDLLPLLPSKSVIETEDGAKVTLP